jgi:hypothetical protein
MRPLVRASRTADGPALRRIDFDNGPRWCENPAFFIVGLFGLLPYVSFALFYPLILVPFAFLLLAAGIRTLRIAYCLPIRETGSHLPRLCGALVESFGVASIAGTAAVVAFACVQFGMPGGNSISSPRYISILALVAASIVFLVLYGLLWPRTRTDDPPDPEN